MKWWNTCWKEMVFNNSLLICTAVTTCRVYRPILLSRQIGIVVPASLGIVAKQHTKKWCYNVSDWLMTSQSARWITQTNENVGISFNFQLKHTFFFLKQDHYSSRILNRKQRHSRRQGRYATPVCIITFTRWNTFTKVSTFAGWLRGTGELLHWP